VLRGLPLVAGIALALWGTHGTAVAAEHAVEIVDFGFQPAELEVTVGDAVTWTNTGADAHTVTSPDGSLDSGTLASGEAYGHVFEAPGRYEYVCDIHPARMQGVVVVTAAGETPPPSGEATPSPPAGTLPPNFSPGLPQTPPPSEPSSPTPTSTPAPADSGAVDGSTIGLVLILAALGLGAAAALVLRARRPR
jgi:plastocyanin